MNKVIVSIICIACMSVSGCGFKSFEKIIKKTMTLEDAIKNKGTLDKADNVAKKYLITKELETRLIELKGLVVKEVIPSNDIDYDFCVVSQVETDRGSVEFYIYSRDIDCLSLLEKGKTKIDVLGDFKRFFTLLDRTFIKIDITDADITIR